MEDGLNSPEITPEMTPEITDEMLFVKVREGEIGAFDVLYGRYEKRLFNFIRRYLSKHEDAEEVFHEAFMGVLKSRDVKFDRGSFCTWLYKIARNSSLNRLRSQGRSAKVINEMTLAQNTNNEASAIDDHQVLMALSHAANKLSRPLIEIYDLRSAGMSYVEMSQVLDIPMGTVKSRMFEMVGQLRKEMEIWNVK